MPAETRALLTYDDTQATPNGEKAVPSSCWVSSLYMKRDGRSPNVSYQTKAAAWPAREQVTLGATLPARAATRMDPMIALRSE